MSIRSKTAFGLYFINAVVLLGFGFRYFFAVQLMPYHAETLGIARDGLSDTYSLVVVTLYQATGAGMLTIGVAVLFLLVIPFRGQQSWSRWALSAVILSYGAPSLYLTLARSRPAQPRPYRGPALRWRL